MGFLDKVKAGAEQAAARAKEELEELQTKRELNAAYGDLGKTAFELLESGAISHDRFAEGVQRVKKLKAELAAAESGGKATAAATPAAAPAEPPPSSQPPAMPS